MIIFVFQKFSYRVEDGLEWGQVSVKEISQEGVVEIYVGSDSGLN